MCFRVYEHDLVHDVRPLVTYKGSPEQQLVNPYALPIPCCQQDETIRPRFRCEFGHGCCYLTPRVVKCTGAAGSDFDCGDTVPYHTYQPARKVYIDGGPDNVVANADEGWYPWRSLHEEIGRPESCNRVFSPHRENVTNLETAVSVIDKAFKDRMVEFRQVETKYRDLKNQHRCERHEVCLRALNDWECPENQLRRDLKETKSRLRQADKDLTMLEIRLNLRRMILDAVVRGFVGERDIGLSM